MKWKESLKKNEMKRLRFISIKYINKIRKEMVSEKVSEIRRGLL